MVVVTDVFMSGHSTPVNQTARKRGAENDCFQDGSRDM